MNTPTPASWAKVARNANLVDDEINIDPDVCTEAGMRKVEALARQLLHEDPRFSKVRGALRYQPRLKLYDDGSPRDPLALVTFENFLDLEAAMRSGRSSHRNIPVIWFIEKFEHGDGGHAWVRRPQQAVAHATLQIAASTTQDIPWEQFDATIWWTVFDGTFLANAHAHTRWELRHVALIDLTDESQRETVSRYDQPKVTDRNLADPTANSVIHRELRRECIRRHAALRGDKNQLRAAYLAIDAIFDELAQQSEQRYGAIADLAAQSGLPDPGEDMSHFFEPLKVSKRCAGRAEQLNAVLRTEMFPEFYGDGSGIAAA